MQLPLVDLAEKTGQEEGNRASGEWDFGIALWFWFITTTTIGFGDFGPEVGWSQ